MVIFFISVIDMRPILIYGKAVGYRAGTGEWCCTVAADPQGLKWGRKPLQGDQHCYQRCPTENQPQTGEPATREPHQPDREHTLDFTVDLNRTLLILRGKFISDTTVYKVTRTPSFPAATLK